MIPSATRVLVVEDDVQLAGFLTRALSEEGFEVVVGNSLSAARASLAASPFHIIIVDWMLPDGDGTELCAELLGVASRPSLLMLTARGGLQDRVSGLNAGADDYLVKPFELDELLARLAALGRRQGVAERTRVGPLEVSWKTHSATLDGLEVEFTGREWALLSRLVGAGGRPVERSTLLSEVWRQPSEPGSGVLDVHVSRLRDKLGVHADLIETVRGVGYRIRVP